MENSFFKSDAYEEVMAGAFNISKDFLYEKVGNSSLGYAFREVIKHFPHDYVKDTHCLSYYDREDTAVLKEDIASYVQERLDHFYESSAYAEQRDTVEKAILDSIPFYKQ